MTRHAASPDEDPERAVRHVTHAARPRRYSAPDSHAELDDRAAADFLLGDYDPGRRYTTADWFGTGQSPPSDLAAHSEEYLADGFGE